MDDQRVPVTVEVESANPAVVEAAQALARRVGAALSFARTSPTEYRLVLNDERLELRDSTTKPGRGLYVDFKALTSGGVRRGLSRNQPLGRAMGRTTRTVIDATAGLGQDAALLACMGFSVLAVERSPVLHALLEHGLRMAMSDAATQAALGGRLSIVNADARAIILKHSADAIYIDPMFPPKRKSSALAKKEIRMVRAVVGDDHDADDLLRIARAHANRVVVKRPNYAPPLADCPTASITTKLVRYDVYARPK